MAASICRDFMVVPAGESILLLMLLVLLDLDLLDFFYLGLGVEERRLL